MFTYRLALLAVSPIVLALAACGNDDTPASTTTLSGQVVKGPVGGSTVCAYAISGGVKATNTLVPCVTSDPVTGNYSLGNISYTGDMIVEATGGSYKDEATGATVTLSAPLKTMVVAQGGATTGMITPLTTIALSTTPNLTNTAFGQSAANVAAQAGLSTTNILTTAPTYASNGTSAANAYAAVLGAIAKYQQTSGSTLSAALAAWTPANQAAFQSALSAYAAAASVGAANLPATFNMTATGTAYTFGASVSNGGLTVTSTGGVVSSSSFTLTGAAGSGFASPIGFALSVAGLQTISFTSLTPQISVLSVATEGSGSSLVTNVLYAEGNKEWRYECKAAACTGKVAISASGKSVTLTNVTLAADTSTGASGTVTASGSGNYN